MSMILKGIDLPKDCDDCMFNFYREGNSCPACYLTKHIVLRKKEENIPTDCPLVEIPSPHGRMIDADKLEAMMYHEAFETDSDMQKWDSGCWIRYKVFENCMNRLLPDTIIEAEE